MWSEIERAAAAAIQARMTEHLGTALRNTTTATAEDDRGAAPHGRTAPTASVPCWRQSGDCPAPTLVQRAESWSTH